MAIGFMPSDEDTDARYERLNRILVELMEVIFHLMNPEPPSTRVPPRARPSSDSAALRLPDVVARSTALRSRLRSQCSAPVSPSCSSSEFFPREASRRLEAEEVFTLLEASRQPLDDEVFLAPGNPPPSPAPLNPPRGRRRKRRSRVHSDMSNPTPINDAAESWRERRTRIEDIQNNQSAVDPSLPPKSEKVTPPNLNPSDTSQLFSSFGGTLFTALVLVVGWTLLANKR